MWQNSQKIHKKQNSRVVIFTTVGRRSILMECDIYNRFKACFMIKVMQTFLLMQKIWHTFDSANLQAKLGNTCMKLTLLTVRFIFADMDFFSTMSFSNPNNKFNPANLSPRSLHRHPFAVPDKNPKDIGKLIINGIQCQWGYPISWQDLWTFD